MVSDSPADRGQLLLVGAVVMAVIVIGLAAVVNTVLFTADVSTGRSGEVADTAESFDRQARESVSSVILRLNHDQRYSNRTTLNHHIARNVSEYVHLRQEVAMAARPAAVDVSFDNASAGTVWGDRLVQSGDDTYQAPNGSDTWQPVSDRAVGYLLFNFNLSATPEEPADPFTVTVTSESTGESITYTFNRTENADSRPILVVTSTPTAGSSLTGQCSPTGNRVVVDLADGDSVTGDCALKGITDEVINVRKPLTVEFEHTTEAVGQYEVVANDSLAPIDGLGTCPGAPADPCVAPAVWQAGLTVEYRNDRIEYENSRNVTIYGTDP